MGKDVLHAECDTQTLPNPAEQLNRQNALPTQSEKIILNPNLGVRNIQHLPHNAHSCFSSSVRGATCRVRSPTKPGSGNACLSSFPLGVSGSSVRCTNRLGTMYSGSLACRCAKRHVSSSGSARRSSRRDRAGSFHFLPWSFSAAPHCFVRLHRWIACVQSHRVQSGGLGV